jgi:phasin family protein
MTTGPETKTIGFTWPKPPDFSRMFSEMKLPSMPDIDAFIAANKRNMETLSAANRVALEGAQAVARRNMEIMQSSMAELTENVKALAGVESPQAKAAKQAELLKKAYEQSVSNIREVGDLIQKANAEALALLHARFVEAMDEVKKLAEK